MHRMPPAPSAQQRAEYKEANEGESHPLVGWDALRQEAPNVVQGARDAIPPTEPAGVREAQRCEAMYDALTTLANAIIEEGEAARQDGERAGASAAAPTPTASRHRGHPSPHCSWTA